MATLNVGAGQAYATLSAAVAASRDGDVIAVQAGTYVNDFATISKDITIVGVGGMANFVATVAPPNGKGILVTQSDVTIQNLSFSGAAVADGNGAGIRYEGGNLVIIDSYFHDNQMSLLAAIAIPTARSASSVRNSAPLAAAMPSITTSMSATSPRWSSTTATSTTPTTATRSRAARNPPPSPIRASMTAPATGSYTIDLPNGGVGVIRDNVIQQGPNSDNPFIIAYGEEGGVYAGSSLLIQGNVVVNDLSGSSSARLLYNATTVTGTVSDNAVYGLTAGQIAIGGATVSGTTFLSTRPALDTSSPWLDTGWRRRRWRPSGRWTVTGLSQDTGTPGDFITSVANQTVSGTYTGTLAAGDVIQVSANGSTWVSATAGAGAWTADVTLLPGEHTLSVRTVDDAGNIVNGIGHAYDLENGGGGSVGAETTNESFGVTQLVQVGDGFVLQDGGGNGPSLKADAAAVVAGQFDAWTPIGAEAAETGYLVAWKNGAADEYTVWNTDGNGNYLWDPIGTVRGTDGELESREPIFQQDLNGDGAIGLTEWLL